MNNLNSQTIERIERNLLEISQEWGAVKQLPEAVSAIRRDVDAIRRGRLNGSQSGPRVKGRISDEAAANLGAHWLMNLDMKGKLPAVCSDDSLRQRFMIEARSVLGIPQVQQRWTGQTTSEFPLPLNYGSEIQILAAEYGVVRNQMTNFPLGIGTAKPPRHKTGMTFGKIAMSAPFDELNPAFEFATLEPHKVGGVVITPRELDWGSIVTIGQYLAKLAAIEFARVEDYWGFLADGSATYESVKGVCAIAADNSKVATMSAGNTAPADATVANFRSLFGLVNSRVLSTGKWYLNATWRCWLPELNTEANQYTYRELPNGEALLFGRPVVWTEVLQAYTENAAASQYIAVFGDLNYWWFAERVNGPRIDVSGDVLFTSDQICTRFIQEMDVDYMASDAAAALKTAAA